MTPRPRLALACLVVIAITTSCNVGQLDFARDERLTITAPRQRAQIGLPVTIRWQVRDFKVTGRDGSDDDGSGYFGVLLDRAPPAPGKTLASLVADDPVCKATPRCPDTAYLAGQGAYSTTKTSFEFAQVTDFSDRGRRRDFHEATIILLDGRGARIGESAFRVEFQVEREKR